MPGRTTLWAMAIGGALLVAGCGGDAASGGAAAGGGVPVALGAHNYAYSPTALTVAPGSTVTLSLTNTGDTTHNFTASDLGVSLDAAAGTTQTVTFTAPQSGSFAFHCKYHPTRMMGTLTVNGSSAAAIPSASAAGAGGGYGGSYP